MDPAEVLLVVAIVAAPMALVAIVALLKGYHVWIHLYRGSDKKKKYRRY